jgi:hypothetical protein
MASVLEKINHLWSKHTDHHMQQFPLLESPIHFIAAIFVSVAIIQIVKIFKPTYKPRKPVNDPVVNGNAVKTPSVSRKDIRPILLIHDGFCFGVYGIGVFMIAAVADFGRMFYTCNYSQPINDFHVQAITHLIYVYLLISFVCYGHPLIQVLGGRPVDVLVDLVHHSIWTAILFCYLSLNPIGLSLVIPIIDCVSKCVNYGSQVLSVSDKEATVAAKWSNFTNTICFAAIAAHSHYFNIYSNSCSKPSNGSPYESGLLMVTCVYASTVAVISATRLLLLFSSSFSASSIEKQVLSSGRTLRKNVRLTKIPVTMMK